MKKILIPLFLLLLGLPLLAQKSAGKKNDVKALNLALENFFNTYQVKGYRPYNAFHNDSVRIHVRERRLYIYPNESFYSQPFTEEKLEEISDGIRKILPDAYRKYKVQLFGKFNRPLSQRIPNSMRKDHKDPERLWRGIDYQGAPWVTPLSLPYTVTNGLAGRHLMVSPSHGRYYKFGQWRWQRPNLFCTSEDLFTQSFVTPFLTPMLEKAGAVVCSARERDEQAAEAIVDNDPQTSPFTLPQHEGAILYDAPMGTYREHCFNGQKWGTIATSDLCPLPAEALDSLGPVSWAFALPEVITADSVNPFRLGTARQIATQTQHGPFATVTWTPQIPRDGKYAVYVSYATVPGSVDDAHYTVFHAGGKTEFLVNQQMGGSTWVYLGTFAFPKGRNDHYGVQLSNRSKRAGVVTADAVRFGGGSSRIARDTVGTSGFPHYIEASRYHAQWAGLPDSLFRMGDEDNDYSDDIRSRSTFLNYLAGGSCYLPDRPGLKVPFEMGLNIHSDAGHRSDHTICGSLSICNTVKKDSLRYYPSGISRLASMDLSSALLDQVTADLSRRYGVEWMRRELWDRNYGEARTPNLPTVILEMLSHQNFADLRLGHDPNFKFDMARAIYKAVLRYVNGQHGIDQVAVQPLPVQQFAALLDEDAVSVTLSWQPTSDPLEPTAEPERYILYTRSGDADFDDGQDIGSATQITLPIAPHVHYDFKITAVNRGGESFPSEVLSVYRNPGSRKEILVVNGFHRLSGPAYIQTPDSVGFDLEKEYGVPYGMTSAFCGPQLDFNPAYAGQEGPGALGFSNSAWEGKRIAGNTFDYAAAHGRAITASSNYSYSSVSRDALPNCTHALQRFVMIDYIAGLEKEGQQDWVAYKSFPKAIRQLLKKYLNKGGNLFVSGAYIASDMWEKDEREFIREVLKFQYDGCAGQDSTQLVNGLNMEFPIYRQPNADHYAVQSPDAIYPASPDAFCAFLYGNGQVAGIAYPGKDYRVLATSFPFECIRDPKTKAKAMGAIIRFLTE